MFSRVRTATAKSTCLSLVTRADGLASEQNDSGKVHAYYKNGFWLGLRANEALIAICTITAKGASPNYFNVIVTLCFNPPPPLPNVTQFLHKMYHTAKCQTNLTAYPKEEDCFCHNIRSYLQISMQMHCMSYNASKYIPKPFVQEKI